MHEQIWMTDLRNALYVQAKQPTLNVQSDSLKAKLFV